MSPSLKDIDARIVTFTAEVDATGSSLAELDGDFTLKLLTSAALSGRTGAEWAVVGPEVARLWAYYGALKDKLAEIVATRGTRTHLKADQIDSLSAALFANSIALPPDPSPATRTLAAPSVQMVSVAWIQAAMAKLFQDIVSLTDRVARAWEALPRLETLDADLTGLVQSAGTSGVNVPAEVASARIAVASLRARVRADPLGADLSGIDAIAHQVDTAREVLRVSVAARAALGGRLSGVADTLGATGVLIDQARAAQTVVAEKVVVAAAGAGSVQALADRLARLRATLESVTSMAHGNWQEVNRLLGQVESESGVLRADAATALQAIQGPMNTRNELRGRLDAYHAKAQVIGMAENEALSAIYERAKTMLFTAPCDVAGAEAAVRAYQQGLSQPGLNQHGSVPETSR